MTLLDDLGLEFWAVVAPLGMRGIALVRVSVHDLHSGHYRFDLTSLQYGVAGRLPLDEESAGREPRATRWSGDVWRLIVLLKKYRPDLSIHTIGTAPTGLAVIQNLNPESTFLIDNMDRLHQEFLSLDYAYIRDDKAIKLNLFPNQWPKIKGMIRRRSIHH